MSSRAKGSELIAYNNQNGKNSFPDDPLRALPPSRAQILGCLLEGVAATQVYYHYPKRVDLPSGRN
jgi:hypothetical protein